jgi:hypothetical protein
MLEALELMNGLKVLTGKAPSVVARNLSGWSILDPQQQHECDATLQLSSCLQ